MKIPCVLRNNIIISLTKKVGTPNILVLNLFRTKGKAGM